MNISLIHIMTIMIFQKVSFLAFDFIALQFIPAGTELRWDYATVEYEIGNFPGNCLCKEEKCRAAVRGFKFSSEILKEQYGPYIAKYLK